MATPETWNKVEEYFRPNSLVDRWGDSYAIQDKHILRLYAFRKFIGVPVFVTAGVKTSGHSKGSFHYSQIDKEGWERGKCATDILVPSYQHSPFDLILDAARFGFAVGYYPHWHYKGKATGGLHVDSRQIENYKQARWMGVMESDKQIYIPLTFENMLKYSQYDYDPDPRLH